MFISLRSLGSSHREIPFAGKFLVEGASIVAAPDIEAGDFQRAGSRLVETPSARGGVFVPNFGDEPKRIAVVRTVRVTHRDHWLRYCLLEPIFAVFQFVERLALVQLAEFAVGEPVASDRRSWQVAQLDQLALGQIFRVTRGDIGDRYKYRKRKFVLDQRPGGDGQCVGVSVVKCDRNPRKSIVNQVHHLVRTVFD